MMGVSYVKECSVFPNGDTIRNDRLVEILEVIYDLLLTYDGQTVLFLTLYKVKFGVLSTRFPRKRKMKDYREFMVNEVGFITKGGRVHRDLRNILLYLDEVNNLYDKLYLRLVEGKKFNFKLFLSLDQYDPKTKKIYPSKNAWKATRDEDYRKRWGEKIWNTLEDLGRDD